MLRKPLILIALLWFESIPGNRIRRHLVFTEGSRLFFSVDVRDNLFNYSDFFAKVFGLKIDWDLPYKLVHGTNKGRIQRRDLYQEIEHLLDWKNLNGTSCVRKFLCEASVVLPKSNHFLAQFYEVVLLGKYGEPMINFNKDCEQTLRRLRIHDCPHSFMSILLGPELNINISSN